MKRTVKMWSLITREERSAYSSKDNDWVPQHDYILKRHKHVRQLRDDWLPKIGCQIRVVPVLVTYTLPSRPKSRGRKGKGKP